MNTEALLEKLGFKDREAKVYLSLLTFGKATASTISKETKIGRTYIYDIIKELQRRGHISQTEVRGVKYFIAEPPEHLLNDLKRRERQIVELEDTVKAMIPQFKVFNSPESLRPKVKFFEGEDGFYRLTERSLQTKEKEILFLSSLEDFYSVTTTDYDDDYYIPTRIERGIFFRQLVFKTDRTQQLKDTDDEQLRKTKFIPTDFKFNTTLFVYDKEASFVTQSDPFVGVLIQEEKLAHMFRMMFEMLWGAF